MYLLYIHEVYDMSSIEFIRSCLRVWNWRLYFFILLFIALPNVYQAYRTAIIGTTFPDPASLAIVSQWQFVGLVAEVLQEAMVLAIFFYVGSQIRGVTGVQLDRAKTALFVTFVILLAYSIVVFVFTDSFIDAAGTPEEIRDRTRGYLDVAIFSIPFTVLAATIVVLFESLGMRRMVLFMAFLNVGLMFGMDMIFFGQYGPSLMADTTGVAWSTLLASMLLFLMGLVLLFRTSNERMRYLLRLPSFSGLRTYLRVGMWSGADSAIRNAAYFVMIIGLVNSIGVDEMAGYYLFIQIMWGLVLVPVLALSESAKALVSNASGSAWNVRRLWIASMLITALMLVAVWLPVLLFFGDIAGSMTGDTDTLEFALVASGILVFPYVMFAFNTVTDSVFYGTGRTVYMAAQSAITNCTVYLGAFVLYTSGVWTPTFEGIMWLFFCGIAVDTCLTLIFLRHLLYRRTIRH